MTGNEIEAEEILANTFIQAFRQQIQPDAFAVDSALVDELHQRFPLKQEEPSSSPIPGLNLGHRNVHRPELEAAIRTLPPTERLLYLLRDVEGYSTALIGRLLDMPEPRVQRSCFSARLRLRQILAEQARTEAA
jgi:RNA polymerase sigma-70 factor, ECF subfamily